MLVRASQLIVILLISLYLVACGDKFESGEKVWLDLPEKSLQKHGYAVGQVIEYKGNMVHIQVLKVDADNNHELLPVLKRGQAYVPIGMLREYESGKERFNEKLGAARKLLDLISKGVSAGSREFHQVHRVAEKYDLVEIKKVLAMYRIQDRYFNKKVSKRKFLLNIPDALGDMTELLEEYPESYQRLVNRVRDYYRQQLERKAAVIGIRGSKTVPGKPVAGEDDLFDKSLTSFAFNIRKFMDGMVSGKVMPVSEAAKNIAAIDKAEKAWARFVTMNGKHLNGAGLKEIISSQQDSARNQLALSARRDILGKITFSKLTSEKMARAAFEKARKEAHPIAEALDRQIINKADEQELFLKSVQERAKARLAADNRAYKHATRKGLGHEQSLKALDAYLKSWPDGSHRIAVQRQKAVVIAAIAKRNERLRKRRNLVVNMLAGGKAYNGKAGYKGDMVAFQVRFSGFNRKTGAFSGTMTWPTRKGHVNVIAGKYNSKDNSIEFRETEQKKAGDWQTGGRYALKPGKSLKLTGTHYYRQYLFMEKKGPVEIVAKP